MNQASTFVVFLNRIVNLFDVEIAVQAMTSPVEVSADDNIDDRKYLKVTASYSSLELHGASKGLFIQIMTNLVMLGDPEKLRIEWAPNHFSLDQEAETVSAHLMVMGHTEFANSDRIQSTHDIPHVLSELGVDIKGVSSIQVLNLPEPKPHEFVTPSRIFSTRALFVSLMLAAYDAGKDVELYWRQEPAIKQMVARKLWKASATALIAPKQRILV